MYYIYMYYVLYICIYILYINKRYSFLMLNFSPLFIRNQIKQSYSYSLTYQNPLFVTYATFTTTQYFIAFKPHLLLL